MDSAHGRTEVSPPGNPEILYRWHRFNRVGGHDRDLVVMTREAWGNADPEGRPDAQLDTTGLIVLVDCPPGWPAHMG